jgi:hypothetical protein
MAGSVEMKLRKDGRGRRAERVQVGTVRGQEERAGGRRSVEGVRGEGRSRRSDGRTLLSPPRRHRAGPRSKTCQVAGPKAGDGHLSGEAAVCTPSSSAQAAGRVMTGDAQRRGSSLPLSPKAPKGRQLLRADAAFGARVGGQISGSAGPCVRARAPARHSTTSAN